MKSDVFFQSVNVVNDLLNPPKMIADLKVNMFRNVISEMAAINKIEKIYCSVFYSKDKTKLITKGEISFKEKNGHSIIESLFMSIDLLESIEMISEFE